MGRCRILETKGNVCSFRRKSLPLLQRLGGLVLTSSHTYSVHTQTHTHPLIPVHSHTCSHTPTRTHSFLHTRTHTYSPLMITPTHPRTLILTFARSHHPVAHSYAFPHAHHTPACTLTHFFSLSHSHICTCTHTHSYTRTHSNSHTHTLTLTLCTLLHTHHIHTRTEHRSTRSCTRRTHPHTLICTHMQAHTPCLL